MPPYIVAECWDQEALNHSVNDQIPYSSPKLSPSGATEDLTSKSPDFSWDDWLATPGDDLSGTLFSLDAAQPQNGCLGAETNTPIVSSSAADLKAVYETDCSFSGGMFPSDCFSHSSFSPDSCFVAATPQDHQQQALLHLQESFAQVLFHSPTNFDTTTTFEPVLHSQPESRPGNQISTASGRRERDDIMFNPQFLAAASAPKGLSWLPDDEEVEVHPSNGDLQKNSVPYITKRSPPKLLSDLCRGYEEEISFLNADRSFEGMERTINRHTSSFTSPDRSGLCPEPSGVCSSCHNCNNEPLDTSRCPSKRRVSHELVRCELCNLHFTQLGYEYKIPPTTRSTRRRYDRFDGSGGYYLDSAPANSARHHSVRQTSSSLSAFSTTTTVDNKKDAVYTSPGRNSRPTVKSRDHLQQNIRGCADIIHRGTSVEGTNQSSRFWRDHILQSRTSNASTCCHCNSGPWLHELSATCIHCQHTLCKYCTPVFIPRLPSRSHSRSRRLRRPDRRATVAACDCWTSLVLQHRPGQPLVEKPPTQERDRKSLKAGLTRKELDVCISYPTLGVRCTNLRKTQYAQKTCYHQSSKDLLPVHFFDLVGGTSTGGLIAILLGRLRMNIPDYIPCYKVVVGSLYDDQTFARKSDPAVCSDGFCSLSHVNTQFRGTSVGLFSQSHDTTRIPGRVSATDRADTSLGPNQIGLPPLAIKHLRHKLDRCTNVDPGDQSRDHFLYPDDGKLRFLRVQQTLSHDRPAHLPASSSGPSKRAQFHKVPAKTLPWTYNDWVSDKDERMDRECRNVPWTCQSFDHWIFDVMHHRYVCLQMLRACAKISRHISPYVGRITAQLPISVKRLSYFFRNTLIFMASFSLVRFCVSSILSATGLIAFVVSMKTSLRISWNWAAMGSYLTRVGRIMAESSSCLVHRATGFRRMICGSNDQRLKLRFG